MRLRPYFLHKVMALGIVNILNFDRFSNFSNIFEHCTAMFEILGSIQKTGCKKLIRL